jgi:hypothetical protein
VDYSNREGSRMKTFLCVFVSILAVSSWAKAEDQINEKNWNNHSAILAIRALFTSIEDSVTRRDFAHSEKNVRTEGEALHRAEAYYENNRIRKLREIVSDEAKTVSTECYYEGKEIIRFIFLSDSYNYPGRERKNELKEFRLYFDKSGNLFWLVSRVNGKDEYMKGTIPKKDSFLEKVISKYKDPQGFYDFLEEECPCSKK